MLNSISNRFPNGLGNDSGELGTQYNGPSSKRWSWRRSGWISRTNIIREEEQTAFIFHAIEMLEKINVITCVALDTRAVQAGRGGAASWPK